MSRSEHFMIGSRVVCTDGECGVLRRVVVDPVSRTITHLAVEPKHRQTGGHLVPVEFVLSAEHEIRLNCTLAAFRSLDEADEAHLVPGAAAGEWEYEQEEMYSMPYYPLAEAGGFAEGGPLESFGGQAPRRVVWTDRVPVGEVEVRRGDEVHASDGAIGRVKGLVVDPTDHHVTHLLLDEGHLWAQKRVTVPIGAVERVDGGVRLGLTKAEVAALPAVGVADVG
jgi:sporulation protein YlmC with PRC-barrel domain